MINRYIIPIRFSLVLLAAVIGIFYSIGSEQRQIGTTQNTLVTINQSCINKLNSCSTLSAIPKKDKGNTMQRSIAAASPKGTCISSQLDSSTYYYDQAIINTLSQANSTIDGYRENALVNGESYVVFNNQLSTIYYQYNAKIQQDYNDYLSELGSCKTNALPPQYFQDYD